MEREQAAFIAAAAGQGFVAGPRGELADDEAAVLVAGEAGQSGLLLEIGRGRDVERDRDGLAVEKLGQTADRARDLDLLTVQRGAAVECEGRVGSGHRASRLSASIRLPGAPAEPGRISVPFLMRSLSRLSDLSEAAADPGPPAASRILRALAGRLRCGTAITGSISVTSVILTLPPISADSCKPKRSDLAVAISDVPPHRFWQCRHPPRPDPATGTARSAPAR